MKILLVTTKATPGGVQVFISSLAKSLVGHGHEVAVAAGVGNFLPDSLNKIPFLRLKSLVQGASFLSLTHLPLELRRLVVKEGPDVVHLNGSHVLAGALLIFFMRNRPKLVFTIHGLSVLDPNYEQLKIKRCLYQKIFRFLLKKIDEVVYICHKNLTDSPLLTQRSTSTIYNGIEPDQLFVSRLEARQEIGKLTGQDLKDKFLMVSIGRLAYQKNYKFLIENWSHVLILKPNSCLVIFGQGEDERALKKMVRDYKYQDSIFILDLAPASVYLKCADLYLQCSRYEGLPYAILEAVQAELPILASDVGGIREILNNDAQLFTLNDSQEFLEKLDNILSHQEKTALTIQNNYKRLSLFSLEKMTQAYLDIYQ